MAGHHTVIEVSDSSPRTDEWPIVDYEGTAEKSLQTLIFEVSRYCDWYSSHVIRCTPSHIQYVNEQGRNIIYIYICILEAARGDKEFATKKWNIFYKDVSREDLSKQEINAILTNLDEKNQWTPLHYAVHYNNLHVFCKLMEEEKRFKCGKFRKKYLFTVLIVCF